MEREFRLPWGWSVAMWTAVAFVLVFLILPVIVIFPLSFSSSQYLEFPPRGWSLQWYRNYVGREDWVSATFLSLKVAVGTSILAMILGTLTAFGLTRCTFKGKNIFLAVVLSPIVMPVIIVAVAIYFFYARVGLLGSFGGLVLAHTLLATPFVVLTVMTSLQGFDRNLELAGMTLGAHPLYTFYRVTLPLIRPGVLSGALFAFVTSFDELVVALFVTSPTAVTLPRRMWEGVRLEVDPTIAAVSAILIIFALVCLGFFELLQARQRSQANTRVS
jgi:ABC-type spermidine/putrescine transport system permease subunit II